MSPGGAAAPTCTTSFGAVATPPSRLARLSAVELVVGWIRSQQLRDASIEVIRLPSRTPLIFVEVAGSDATVLLYGHIDKQPPLASWAEGLDPWTPVVRDGRLYGRCLKRGRNHAGGIRSRLKQQQPQCDCYDYD